jgi:1-acyl-sn-glycerol-3-phosphate acyltransferase
MADPILKMGFLKRQIFFMYKIELTEHFPLKYLLPPADPIPVRRGKVDRVALRQAEAVLRAGNILGIYPEGTRSKSATAQEAQSGAVFLAQRVDAPILPVAISGTERMFSRHFPWYRRVPVRITFGAPFTLADLAGEAGVEREALAQAIMRRVAMLLPPAYRGVYADELVSVGRGS